ATSGSQYLAAATALPNGGAIVSWSDQSGALGDADIGVRAQIFAPSGAKSGSEFLVNTTTTGTQQWARFALLGETILVAVSQDNSGVGDNSGYGIKGQLFDLAGQKTGAEFMVNTVTASDQLQPAVAAFAEDQFVVVWEDHSETATGNEDGEDYTYTLPNIKAQM